MTSKVNNSLEYDHLAVALKKLAEIDDDKEKRAFQQSQHPESYAFSPKNLASMTPAKMNELLEPHLQGYYLDNLEKRAMLWKEVGETLLQHFDGSASKLLARAEKNAAKLVELIFHFFPGFRDEIQNDGRQNIFFLKRAQIFVGDVNAALKLGMDGMEELTTFADYRVPQILRHFDILEYSPALAEIVDSQKELAMGSSDEISIRAATVTAVEDLVTFLNEGSSGNPTNNGERFTAVTVDWYLWQVGERMHQAGLMKPFHKVRTHFY
jgi:hypothetical protein